jgi:hypothetical protein
LYLGFKVPVSMGSGKSRCHERQLWLHYDWPQPSWVQGRAICSRKSGFLSLLCAWH